METKKRTLNVTIYLAIIFFALIFLFFGNRFASQGMVIEYNDDEFLTVEVKVLKILDITEEALTEWLSSTTVTFEAVITKGSGKNEVVTATQILADSFGINPNEVAEGDKVILILNEGEWNFVDHVKIDKIFILGSIFIILLLLFGRSKGFNAILSLGFTCAAIFAVFIPSILSGKNIYVSSIIVCVYSIAVTLFLLNGVNKKSLAAVAGCFGGVIAAGLLTLIMNRALGLTGWINSESIHLANLPTENPIDLKAIIFAGIIIGAVGAIMDVAVSISSALWELKAQAPKLSFSGILKSGVNIGKDIMGSMTNTLVLAYIGSSLTIILLLVVYSTSFTELLNREMVIVELLQSLVGSLGILLTMPLTALVCAVLFAKKPKTRLFHRV